MPESLSDLTLDDFARRLAIAGFAAAHAGPVLRAHYGQGSSSPRPGLLPPTGLEEWLATAFTPAAEVVQRAASADGTVKLLLRCRDGATIEAVLMPGDRSDRAAGCLSSQVGCAMGCDFCATARSGFLRHLSAGEIVEQFRALRREAAAQGRALKTVVFMGMGEPMLNLPAVLAAAERFADNQIGGLGWRQITVSTVGVIPGIDALTAAGHSLNLAVSLHAPDDATRARLLPPGRRFAVADVLAAADRFQAARGRPVTLQYCLLRGVNDAPEQAEQLAGLVGARRMHVNLLHYNATGPGLGGARYEAVPVAGAEAFAAILRRRGVVAHFRRPRGPDIDAACGQLRRRVLAESAGDVSPRDASA